MAHTSEKSVRTSAIEILEQDHERVQKLLTQLAKAQEPGRRAELFARIREQLLAHAKAEEAVFYPAYRDAAKSKEDRKLFFEAHEEHHLVDAVIEELDATAPDSDVFAAKAKVLKELVEHHAEEEEDEMFPRARKLLDKETLAELGARIEAFKRELSAEAKV